MAEVNKSLENSIQKAREAQIKFEEQKKKIEETKAKVEAAAKRAKEIQQRLKELQAVYKAGGSVKGGISAIVASQVGNVRALLIVQVQKNVLAMLTKFSSQCPNPKDLQRIIKTRNTLLKNVSGLRQRVQKFNTVASSLQTTATLVKTLIQVITSIPLPTAIIPPMTGGIGIPVSILTKYSNSLVKLNKTLDKIIDESGAIASVVSSIAPPLQTTEDRLRSIDALIQQCTEGASTQADLAALLSTAQPQGNTGSEGTPSPDYLYKGYKLEIIQDPNSPKIAPRRYAIAKDRRGIIVLRGDSSFSSSTDVLLEEIKFRIDNQLP
jgi:DNA repair exonuclease SbcCD ATPase subunit